MYLDQQLCWINQLPLLYCHDLCCYWASLLLSTISGFALELGYLEHLSRADDCELDCWSYCLCIHPPPYSPHIPPHVPNLSRSHHLLIHNEKKDLVIEIEAAKISVKDRIANKPIKSVVEAFIKCRGIKLVPQDIKRIPESAKCFPTDNTIEIVIKG